ncbi:MAG: methyltransferase type 11, partial [Gammaproteobacteria bacterium]|nr:methyltransferase type 11 [Gammaproteobacteria bacterium]
SERRVPQALVSDPRLYGECLSGALYWNDFLTLARGSGFSDPRLVEDRPLTIDNPEIEQILGPHNFFSATYRLFKIPELEGSCEDYGQAVIYRGTVAHHPDHFALDKEHVFESGKVVPVCGNSWRMLQQSRFVDHFEFIGNWNSHFGIFNGCGTRMPFTQSVESAADSTPTGCC